MKRLVLAAAAALLSCALGSALAQSGAYPNRTVRLIVPFAPGGATDFAARVLGQSLEKQFGQPHVVENRPGAFTQIGTDAGAKATPDGYTLLFSGNTAAVEQVVNKQWTTRVERDLTVISMFSRSGISLIVNASLPINNLKDLAAWSKANPGKLNQGLAGTSSADVDEIKAHLGIQSVDIAYKGGPLMIQGVVTGDAHFSTGSPQDVVEFIKAGKVRAIVYLEKERHPLLPNVPTVAESGVGLDNFDSTIWFALFGPGGLPADIATKLQSAVQVAQSDPEVLDRLQKVGMRAWPLRGNDARARILQEVKVNEDRLARGIVKAR